MDVTLHAKIAAFFEKYPAVEYPKGNTFIMADTTLEHVYYLEKGCVREYDVSKKGDEIVVNVFQPHSFFPLSTAINNTINKYFYQAFTDSTLKVAPKNDVVEFLKSNNDVLFDVLSRVFIGVEGLQRRMAHLMGGTAESRLVFELLIESERFGTQQKDGTFTLKITEEELASRSGLSRETVSRELRKLKSKKLLNIMHGKITSIQLDTIQASIGSDL